MGNMKRLSLARRALLPGKASLYINRIDTLRPGDRVVLWVRKSKQERDRLDAQESNLRRIARQRGLIVVSIVKKVWGGTDPQWLTRAAELARRHGACAILGESLSRFCRSHNYAPDRQSAQPHDNELRWMAYLAEGVPLVTDLDPDATWETERGYQTRRNGTAGRPRRARPGEVKQRRLESLPRVLALHAAGMKKRRIAAELELPESTVRRWLEAAV
jgi:hypothetical protein